MLFDHASRRASRRAAWRATKADSKGPTGSNSTAGSYGGWPGQRPMTNHHARPPKGRRFILAPHAGHVFGYPDGSTSPSPKWQLGQAM